MRNDAGYGASAIAAKYIEIELRELVCPPITGPENQFIASYTVNSG
jgi:hypothetical protein